MLDGNIFTVQDWWLAREKGEQLRFEASRLDAILSTYAEHMHWRQQFRPVPPLEHHSMLNDTECGCITCVEWAARREDFITALQTMPKGHRWSICTCAPCRTIGQNHLSLMAATNKRDLLIEIAFYAHHHSEHPEKVMNWLDEEMKRPKYTLNWCAQEMSRFSMNHWLRLCEQVVGPVISGAVFQNGVVT